MTRKRKPCPSEVRLEPDCAGGVEVRCELLKGHMGAHMGQLNSFCFSEKGSWDTDVELSGEVQWTTTKRKPVAVRGGGVDLRTVDKLLREHYKPAFEAMAALGQAQRGRR